MANTTNGPAAAKDDMGFPVSYADPSDAPAPTSKDDHVYDLTSGDDAPTTDTPAAAVAADATPTPAPENTDMAPTAPPANGKAKPKAKRTPTPGPTNNPAENPNTPKAKPAAKTPKPRTQASVSPAFRPVELPAGNDVEIPVKEVIRDRRFQMRAAKEDAGTVEKYKQMYKDDPNALPGVEIMLIPQSEADALGYKTRYVLWDGFQRTAAREQAGLKSIKATVREGTAELATRLALRANAGHGLPRTFADLRRAFQRIIDDDELKAKVLSEGVGKGGAVRSLASAVGCSTGYVVNTLRAMGLRTAGDKIVKLPATETTPKAKTPSTVPAATNHESREALKSRTSATIIHDITYALAGIQRRYLSLLERDDVKGLLKELAAKWGIPFADAGQSGGQTDPNAKPDEFATTEFWPAVDTLAQCMDEVKQQHDKIGVATPTT
jgi:hypothetical protein